MRCSLKCTPTLTFTTNIKIALTKKEKYRTIRQCCYKTRQQDQHLPNDIPILKRLNESVARFEKFRRDYTDYNRFREKVRKQGSQMSLSAVDSKFTIQYVKKLIAESESMEIQMSVDYFDKSTLEADLEQYQIWK